MVEKSTTEGNFEDKIQSNSKISFLDSNHVDNNKEEPKDKQLIFDLVKFEIVEKEASSVNSISVESSFTESRIIKVLSQDTEDKIDLNNYTFTSIKRLLSPDEELDLSFDLKAYLKKQRMQINKIISDAINYFQSKSSQRLSIKEYNKYVKGNLRHVVSKYQGSKHMQAYLNNSGTELLRLMYSEVSFFT